MLNMSKLGMNCQTELKLQKALDKVAVFLQFYLKFIWKKTLDHCKKSCQGMVVPIEENKCLLSLYYADDQVKIAHGADDLECILKRLNKAYKEGSLTTNFNKTQFISINTDQGFLTNTEENDTIEQVQTLNICVLLKK